MVLPTECANIFPGRPLLSMRELMSTSFVLWWIGQLELSQLSCWACVIYSHKYQAIRPLLSISYNSLCFIECV